jgi:hypothetical protein
MTQRSSTSCGCDLGARTLASPAAEHLVERGLMRLDATLWPPRIFFIDPGLAGLRALIADRRLANPAQFAHVRRELGIDALQQDDGATA